MPPPPPPSVEIKGEIMEGMEDFQSMFKSRQEWKEERIKDYSKSVDALSGLFSKLREIRRRILDIYMEALEYYVDTLSINPPPSIGGLSDLIENCAKIEASVEIDMEAANRSIKTLGRPEGLKGDDPRLLN